MQGSPAEGGQSLVIAATLVQFGRIVLHEVQHAFNVHRWVLTFFQAEKVSGPRRMHRLYSLLRPVSGSRPAAAMGSKPDRGHKRTACCLVCEKWATSACKPARKPCQFYHLTIWPIRPHTCTQQASYTQLKRTGTLQDASSIHIESERL